MSFFFFFFFILLQCLSSFVTAQQPYVGLSTTDCSVADNSTSVLGYSCNGLNRTCLAYVTFRSTPPFSTVSSISSLFSVDPSLVSSLNNAATASTSFPSDQQVIIPVTCSCSGSNGSYSQSNLTYTIRQNDSYFRIANDTLQGLSTCQALERQNNVSSHSLFPGMRIVVPVRCACPTAKQVKDGVNYLVSYTVVIGDSVDIISQRFGVETSKTLEANQMPFENPGVFPFTTVLVPLQNPPTNLNSRTPPPPPPTQSASPPLSPDGGKSKRTWVYVLAGVLGGALVLSVIGAAVFCLVKKESRKKEEPGNLDTFTGKKPPISEQESEFDPLDGLSGMVVDTLKVYKFHELQSATSDFTSSSSIGGSRYIGKINGDGAMIKKIEGNASEEINLLSKLNHFNIIRLSGFCFHEGDWYLVYEHASNGSLSDWIHAKPLLSLTQRLQIALDIATGLNYLHNFADPPYVHRDLTSGNIFLDFEFRAKIGNLGLARSTEREGDYVLTKHVEGTRGYLAPEYLEHGLVSTKLDVYAFGVVFLEIVTGKEASELKREIDGGNKMEKLLIRGSFLPEELVSFVVRLVMDCLKRDHLNRPSMDEIVLSLSKILTASKSWDLSFKV